MPNAAQNQNNTPPNVVGGPRNLNVKYNNLRSSLSMVIYGVLLIMIYLPAVAIDRVVNHTHQMLADGEKHLKANARKNGISDEEVNNISGQLVTVKLFLDRGIRSIGTDTPDLAEGAMIPRRQAPQLRVKVTKMIKSATHAVNRVLPRDVMTIMIVALMSSLYYVLMDISNTCYKPTTTKNVFMELVPSYSSTRNKQCTNLKLAWNPSLIWIKACIFAVAGKMAIGYLTLLTPTLLKSGFKMEDIRALAGKDAIPGVQPLENTLTRPENPGTARPGTARPGTARPGTARPGTAGRGMARPGTAAEEI